MQAHNPGSHLTRHHHVTIGTGAAQEDYDFHTRVLGMKSVKKTLFYDGAVPIYHLYYGNDRGDESSLVTTFPMAHTGVRATPGSGQVSYVSLSAPSAAVDYWRARLLEHGFAVRDVERFGERYVDFQHPCGVNYAIVGVDGDVRPPRSAGPVPAEVMLRGTHSIGVSTRSMDFMDEFMEVAWGGRRIGEDGPLVRY
ncbi:MAG: VOC family protein, partial [Phycisphaerales bacterium]|nr:VOC family protein [Phycisphaerales bacterium]